MDLRYTLRMLGIPIDGNAYMFGDNQSVITSSTIPHFSLNKRHNALLSPCQRGSLFQRSMVLSYLWEGQSQ